MADSLINKTVRSPLTGGVVEEVAEFDSNEINERYKAYYGIDVSSIFAGRQSIKLYKCKESNYEFFHPKEIAGGAEFYRKLAGFQWYYISWKWEHQIALEYIKPSKSVLEVGCGAGSFLDRLQEVFPEKRIRGLELTKLADQKEFILNKTVEEYSLFTAERFDVVCSFQVLEHVYDVANFLKGCLELLNPNGLLILGVPNNASILQSERGESILNVPPHHMGLWNEHSIEYLTRIYPWKLLSKQFEPVAEYHIDWLKTQLQKKIKPKFLKPLMYRNSTSKLILAIAKKLFRGHTMLAVFQKTV